MGRGRRFSLADCAAAPSLFYADWVHPIDEQLGNRARLSRAPARAAVVRARRRRGAAVSQRTSRSARRTATDKEQQKGCVMRQDGATSMRNQEVAYDRSHRKDHRAQGAGVARLAGADRPSRVRHVVPRAARRAVRARQAVARGQITYPGYEHVRMEVVVQKMEPERLFSFTWHPYAVEPERRLLQRDADAGRVHAGADRRTARCCASSRSGFDKIPAHRRDEAFRMNEGGWAAQMEKHRATCRQAA